METNKTQEQIVFDELDKKCHEAIKLILNTLSSTGETISKLLSFKSNELKEIIKEELPNGWKLDRKYFGKKYLYPLIDKNGDTNLSPKFNIEYYFRIQSKSEKKQIEISIGYCIGKYEEEILYAGFYFALRKGISAKKSFNETIINQNKSFNIRIFHSSNWEEVEVLCNELNVEQIDNSFMFFKNKILIPILKV